MVRAEIIGGGGGPDFHPPPQIGRFRSWGTPIRSRVGKNLQSILLLVRHILRFWVSHRSVKTFYAKITIFFV